SYADCVETSLRNLLGALIFNEGKFDASILARHSAVSPALLAYFTKYQRTESIQSQEHHNAWSELISNVEELSQVYKNEDTANGEKVRYEVRSSLDNVLL